MALTLKLRFDLSWTCCALTGLVEVDEMESDDN